LSGIVVLPPFWFGSPSRSCVLASRPRWHSLYTLASLHTSVLIAKISPVPPRILEEVRIAGLCRLAKSPVQPREPVPHLQLRYLINAGQLGSEACDSSCFDDPVDKSSRPVSGKQKQPQIGSPMEHFSGLVKSADRQGKHTALVVFLRVYSHYGSGNNHRLVYEAGGAVSADIESANPDCPHGTSGGIYFIDSCSGSFKDVE
jgi:hypothetical protein